MLTSLLVWLLKPYTNMIFFQGFLFQFFKYRLLNSAATKYFKYWLNSYKVLLMFFRKVYDKICVLDILARNWLWSKNQGIHYTHRKFISRLAVSLTSSHTYAVQSKVSVKSLQIIKQNLCSTTLMKINYQIITEMVIEFINFKLLLGLNYSNVKP